jgi:hypothetical protein
MMGDFWLSTLFSGSGSIPISFAYQKSCIWLRLIFVILGASGKLMPILMTRGWTPRRAHF